MMLLMATAALAYGLGASVAAAQAPVAGGSEVLALVDITQAVLANGKPLPAGSYELRLTSESVRPLPGQSPDAERWVEFLAEGSVVAREVAVVLRDADRPAVGASSAVAASGTRVELLKGGEFLRVSVRRGAERYLIHLPVVR